VGISIEAIVLFVESFCAASVVISIMLMWSALKTLPLPPKSPGGKSRKDGQLRDSRPREYSDKLHL
jgi:hypothetical protein